MKIFIIFSLKSALGFGYMSSNAVSKKAGIVEILSHTTPRQLDDQDSWSSRPRYLPLTTVTYFGFRWKNKYSIVKKRRYFVMLFVETTAQTIKHFKKLTKMMLSMPLLMLPLKTECIKIQKCVEFAQVSWDKL